MKTYACLFFIGECEFTLELSSTSWLAVEEAAEKIARVYGATYSHSTEKALKK